MSNVCNIHTSTNTVIYCTQPTYEGLPIVGQVVEASIGDNQGVGMFVWVSVAPEQHFVRKTFPTRPILNQRENTKELLHNKVIVLSSAFISKCLIVVTLYIAVFLSHQIPNDHMGNNRDHMVCRLNRCHHTWIIIRKSEGLMKPSCLLTLIISINLVWTYYNSC